jgi:hypothetical protein
MPSTPAYQQSRQIPRSVGSGTRDQHPAWWRLLNNRRSRKNLNTARRAADKQLLDSSTVTPDLAWRVDEIVSTRNRLETAAALRHVVHSADARLLPGASPLNRHAVRALTDDLNATAHRLAAIDQPIDHRGMLLLTRLLQDDQGPLYVRYRDWELDGALKRARAAL